MAIAWRFFLARSSDPTYRICELRDAKQRQLTLDMLRPGSFQATVPFDSETAKNVTPWRTCVVAERLGVPRWSGPITTVRGSFASKQVSITAAGWLDILNHRIVRVKRTFTDIDAGTIASSVVDDANAISATGLDVTYVQTTQPRSITYEIGTFVGQIIQSLAEIEDGYDFTVDPITKEIRIYVQKSQTRPNTVFAIGAPPHNVSELAVHEDGTTLCNHFLVKGELNWAEANDAPSQSNYGVFDDFESIDTKADNVLLAYAGVETILRATPRITFEITPYPWSPDGAVPGFGVDYDIGDVVYLTAQGGRYDITRQAQRIYGAALNIDEEGDERVGTLRTVPS
jgi:Siphovirus ReqiPepy6 Gp37-like protein